MKKLSQIVDLKKIKVVNKNIDKAHGLPNECYTDPDYLSVERKKIFENKWVVIGVGSSVRQLLIFHTHLRKKSYQMLKARKIELFLIFSLYLR